MNSTNMEEVTVDYTGTETELAWFVTDGTTEDWVPKSQCTLVKDGKVWKLTGPEWLLKEKGFL